MEPRRILAARIDRRLYADFGESLPCPACTHWRDYDAPRIQHERIPADAVLERMFYDMWTDEVVQFYSHPTFPVYEENSIPEAVKSTVPIGTLDK